MGTPSSRTRLNDGRRMRPAPFNLLRPASDVSFADDTASEDGSSFLAEVRSADAVVHSDPAAAAKLRTAGSESRVGVGTGTGLDHAVTVCFAESELLDDEDAESSSLVRSFQQPVVIVTPPGDDDAREEADVEAASADRPAPPTPPRFRRRNSVSLPAGLNAIMEPPEYELRLTPERTHAEGYDTSDTFSDVVTDDEEDTNTKPTAVVGNRLAMPLRSPGRPTRNQQIVAEDGPRPYRTSLRAPTPLPATAGTGTPTKNGKGAVNHEQEGDDLLLELGLHNLHTDSSPGNSITSMTSISSLLKEKLALTLPAMLKKYRKPKEYKLRGFVVMLFLSIVFLVGFAHVFYNHQVLQRAYFDLIRLNKHERVVRIFSAEGTELLKGELGTLIAQGEKPYACLARDERHDGSVCLEWMHQARLYLQYERHDKVHCYRMTWTSLNDRVHPTDCYDLSAGGSNWYGGGRPSDMRWPIGSGKVGYAPFLTGDSVSGRHQWGNVLRRYFISSKGVAITIDPATPLYVSLNDQMCFQARHDDFAYVREPGVPAVLNYSLCTMDTMNMTELHRQLSEKSLWDGLKDTDVEVIYKLLTEPVWQITPQVADDLSETAILNYTEDVISLGFFRQGHILLNELWQSNLGDLAMDEDRFPTMEDTINIVHRRGFKVALTIQPFIGTESTNFVDAVRQQLFVGSRGSNEYVPALTRYKSLLSAGALDLTNPESAPWLQEKLKDLVRRYNMDGFFLDMGIAYDLPHYYKFENRLTNPDHYKAKFTETVQSVVTVVGVSSAIKRPRPPTFVTLPAVPSSWKGLQSIIPTILTYGMIGYPFVMPGAIGGDFVNATLVEPLGGLRQDSNRTSSSTTTTPSSSAATDDPAIQAVLSVQSSVGEEQLQQVEVLEDAELYLRWQQLATFLPVIRYTHLPNKYGNAQVLENARMLTTLRQKTINPVLRKYTREALDLGLPIVRPLWMLDSQDPACRVVADEFSIGDDIIVAPVLKPGSVEREVYLPTGVWKDGIDGSLRKGNRWIHMYKVPVDKIAYFVKMPDNTRF